MKTTAKDIVWITKDGEYIPVSKMARTHIMFTIARMDRIPSFRAHYRPRLELELRVRDAIGRED